MRHREAYCRRPLCQSEDSNGNKPAAALVGPEPVGSMEHAGNRKEPQFSPLPTQRAYLRVYSDAVGKGLDISDVALAVKVASPKKAGKGIRPEAISRWRADPAFEEWVAAECEGQARKLRSPARSRFARLALKGSVPHYRATYIDEAESASAGSSAVLNNAIVVHVHS